MAAATSGGGVSRAQARKIARDVLAQSGGAAGAGLIMDPVPVVQPPNGTDLDVYNLEPGKIRIYEEVSGNTGRVEFHFPAVSSMEPGTLIGVFLRNGNSNRGLTFVPTSGDGIIQRDGTVWSRPYTDIVQDTVMLVWEAVVIQDDPSSPTWVLRFPYELNGGGF